MMKSRKIHSDSGSTASDSIRSTKSSMSGSFRSSFGLKNTNKKKLIELERDHQRLTQIQQAAQIRVKELGDELQKSKVHHAGQIDNISDKGEGLVKALQNIFSQHDRMLRQERDAVCHRHFKAQCAAGGLLAVWMATAVHVAPSSMRMVLLGFSCVTLIVFGAAMTYLNQDDEDNTSSSIARQEIAKTVSVWRNSMKTIQQSHKRDLSDGTCEETKEDDRTRMLGCGVLRDRTRDPEYIERKNAYIQGMVAKLNPEQLKSLEKMRENFKNATCIEIEEDIGTFRLNDETFLRFLRARNYHVDKASEMLQNHLKWRDEICPPKIKPEDIAEPLRSGMARRGGVNNVGEPIVMVQIKYFDPANFDSVTHFIKYVAYFYELNLCVVEPEVSKGLIFVDMKGYSARKHMGAKARKIINAFVQIVQDQNPETLRKLVLFNVPGIFELAWQVIAPAIDPVVRDKVMFANNLHALREDIPPDQLNVRYGGDKEDEWPIDGLELLM